MKKHWDINWYNNNYGFNVYNKLVSDPMNIDGMKKRQEKQHKLHAAEKSLAVPGKVWLRVK